MVEEHCGGFGIQTGVSFYNQIKELKMRQISAISEQSQFKNKAKQDELQIQELNHEVKEAHELIKQLNSEIEDLVKRIESGDAPELNIERNRLQQRLSELNIREREWKQALFEKDSLLEKTQQKAQSIHIQTVKELKQTL